MYIFDSMSDYIHADIMNSRLQLVVRSISSILIANRLDKVRSSVKYRPWEVKRSKVILQYGKSLDFGIFCCRFVEYLVTNTDRVSLVIENMSLFRKQYVAEMWANKFLW